MTEPGIKETENKLPVELDFDFLESILKRMAKNKSKYPKGNWKKEMSLDQLKDSLFRHTLSVMKSDYDDEGIKLDHLAAIACNAMFIYHQLKNYNDNKG